MTTPLPTPLQTPRQLVLGSYYGLYLVLFFNSLTMTTGLTVTTLVIWLLQIAPLLIFLPGLRRAHVRSHAWLSFVVLMYFVHGVLTAFTPGRLVAGLLEVAFCSALFIALIVYIRRYRSVPGPASTAGQ